MGSLRLIPRLDIKGPNLIKGIHLEGLRVMGDPKEFAQAYYAAGADELLYIDTVASLYGRENILDIVDHTTNDVFIPVTAGGGVSSIKDIQLLLNSGADKVAINTAATKRPELLSEAARHFGSQCVVLSVEAIRQTSGNWEAFTDCGRERTGLDVIKWVQRAQELGVGEILVTSVDQEGTRKGFDVDLVGAVCRAVSIPVIASGGMGQVGHINELAKTSSPSAVAMADILHYKRMPLGEIRRQCAEQGIMVRNV